MQASAIFSPFELCGLKLKNRVVMAPMTREMAPNGVPTSSMAEYYARRATGGTGLLITEGAAPSFTGAFGARVPRLFGDAALVGWKRVVEAVHDHGAHIFAQIWHVGAFRPSLIGMTDSIGDGIDRISPSGFAAPGVQFGRAMSQTDIDLTINDFVLAARNAKSVGFDGIELHGAHGYLIDQFLWAKTNLRTDHYGGVVENRCRFPCDLVQAVREEVGEDFPISFRISQWKQLDYTAQIALTADELAQLVTPLARAGVDIFHCSTRRYWEQEFGNSPKTLAGWVKALTGKPSIAVGCVTMATDFKAAQGKIHSEIARNHVEDIDQRISSGDFDLIAVGRALLANPDWCKLVREGRLEDLVPFDMSVLESLH